MALKIEKGGWIVIGLIGVGLVGYSLQKYGILEKVAPSAKVQGSTVPKRVDLPVLNPSLTSNVPAVAAPGTAPGCTDKPEVRMLVWAWNAQMGLMFANWRPARHDRQPHVQARREPAPHPPGRFRQDAGSAGRLRHRAEGGRGAAHQGRALRRHHGRRRRPVPEGLERHAQAPRPRLHGEGGRLDAGYSRGEDKFMGPPEWKTNPQASRGGLVAGVLRDGDWNIAQKWLGDNSLCNNPDEKTYDPELPQLGQRHRLHRRGREIRRQLLRGPPGGCQRQEDRREEARLRQRRGHLDARRRQRGAEARRLVSIVSTKEYSSQMPNVIIGIDKWMQDNRREVEGMLQAIFDGADQVKATAGRLACARAESAPRSTTRRTRPLLGEVLQRRDEKTSRA